MPDQWDDNPTTSNVPQAEESSHAPAQEGELGLSVLVNQSCEVAISFPHPVKWFALEPDEAIDFARVVAANAEKAQKLREKLGKAAPKIVDPSGTVITSEKS